jgi:hypothetical protein
MQDFLLKILLFAPVTYEIGSIGLADLLSKECQMSEMPNYDSLVETYRLSKDSRDHG